MVKKQHSIDKQRYSLVPFFEWKVQAENKEKRPVAVGIFTNVLCLNSYPLRLIIN